MKSVLEEGRFELPNSDSLQADLISPGYKYDSAGRLLIETLDELGNPAGGFGFPPKLTALTTLRLTPCSRSRS